MTEKRFTIEFDEHQYFLVIDEDNERCIARLDTRIDALAWLEIYKILSEENEYLKSEYKVLHTQYQDLKKFVENNFDEHLTQQKLTRQIIKLSDENEQLKQQIKDLRLNVLGNIKKSYEIQCCCNPCVVEECVKKVVE